VPLEMLAKDEDSGRTGCPSRKALDAVVIDPSSALGGQHSPGVLIGAIAAS
jgi:hypothetical protein